MNPKGGPFLATGPGLLEATTYKIKALGLVASDMKTFSCFHIYAYVKHVTPPGGFLASGPKFAQT